jgi:hypothetical protein
VVLRARVKNDTIQGQDEQFFKEGVALFSEDAERGEGEGWVEEETGEEIRGREEEGVTSGRPLGEEHPIGASAPFKEDKKGVGEEALTSASIGEEEVEVLLDEDAGEEVAGEGELMAAEGDFSGGAGAEAELLGTLAEEGDEARASEFEGGLGAVQLVEEDGSRIIDVLRIDGVSILGGDEPGAGEGGAKEGLEVAEARGEEVLGGGGLIGGEEGGIDVASGGKGVLELGGCGGELGGGSCLLAERSLGSSGGAGGGKRGARHRGGRGRGRRGGGRRIRGWIRERDLGGGDEGGGVDWFCRGGRLEQVFHHREGVCEGATGERAVASEGEKQVTLDSIGTDLLGRGGRTNPRDLSGQPAGSLGRIEEGGEGEPRDLGRHGGELGGPGGRGLGEHEGQVAGTTGNEVPGEGDERPVGLSRRKRGEKPEIEEQEDEARSVEPVEQLRLTEEVLERAVRQRPHDREISPELGGQAHVKVRGGVVGVDGHPPTLPRKTAGFSGRRRVVRWSGGVCERGRWPCGAGRRPGTRPGQRG